MDALPIINHSYEIYKAIVDMNEKLDKRHKYSLGRSIELSALSLLEQLIMSKHAPKPLKASYLLKANADLEILRFKLRLLLDLKLANETKVLQSQSKLQEIGRMLGGWIRSI